MNRVQAVVRLKIHPGKLEEFKRLSESNLRLAREKDTGTVRHDIFLNRQETEAVVYEEFVSPEAHLQHFKNMGSNIEALFAIVDMQGEVWGTPHPAMSAALEEHGVKVYTPFLRLAE